MLGFINLRINIRQILFHLGMCSSPLRAAIWFSDSVLETRSRRTSITFVQLWEEIWHRRHCSPYAPSWHFLSQPVWSCEGRVSSVFCILNAFWQNRALYSTSEEQRKMFFESQRENQTPTFFSPQVISLWKDWRKALKDFSFVYPFLSTSLLIMKKAWKNSTSG